MTKNITLINGEQRTYSFHPEKVSGYTVKRLKSQLFDLTGGKEKKEKTGGSSEVGADLMEIGIKIQKENMVKEFEIVAELLKISWSVVDADVELIASEDYDEMYDETKKTFFRTEQ